jgi:hypothetical protein
MFGYLSRRSEEEILRAACALRRSAGEPVEQSVAHSLPRQMGGFERHSQQGKGSESHATLDRNRLAQDL